MTKAELWRTAKGIVIMVILSEIVGVLSVKFHGG